MKLTYKDDWDEARARMEAWWKGEIIDRVPIKVTAPKEGQEETWPIASAFPMSSPTQSLARIFVPKVTPDNLEDYFTNPKQVIPRLENAIKATYWGGEAFPVMFPVSAGMVAILASYLGSPLKFLDTNTTWSAPIIDNWDNRQEFCFNPENKWWKKTKILLQEAASRAPGRYFVGIPDLNGPSEILSRLRGPSNLCLDIIENRDEIKKVVDEITHAWLRYWEACHGIIHQYIGGYINWMSIFSEAPFTDLQSTFSCLISPKDFNELILPSIEQQTEWINRTIYLLSGPDALRHLDSLLSLRKLSGIEWSPGAGSPPMSEWIPLLKKIQKAGKLQQIRCEKGEVVKILRELSPKGILLETACGSIKEAELLINNVKKLTYIKRWI